MPEVVAADIGLGVSAVIAPGVAGARLGQKLQTMTSPSSAACVSKCTSLVAKLRRGGGGTI